MPKRKNSFFFGGGSLNRDKGALEGGEGFSEGTTCFFFISMTALSMMRLIFGKI